jgi:hypothetical protein
MSHSLGATMSFWAILTILLLVFSRVWLLRTLAPASSWPRAALAAFTMNGADFFIALMLPASALARIACAMPIYVGILAAVYSRRLGDTLSASGVLVLAILSTVLHGLIAMGVVCFVLLLGHDEAVFSSVLLAGLMLLVGIRQWNAWRARALAKRLLDAL